MSRTPGGYYGDAPTTRAGCRHCDGELDDDGHCVMCGRGPADNPEADGR